NGKPAAAMLQKIFVAAVGFFRRGKAGELAHSKKFAAIAGGVNTARVGRFAGIAEITFLRPVLRQIGLRVEAVDWDAGDRGETGMAVLVAIHAGGRADGALGSFFQSGCQSLLGPLLFRVRRMAVLEYPCDRTLGDLWLLVHAIPSALFG